MCIIRFIFLFFLATNIFACTEKTTYSGKIINQKDITNLKISNKKELLSKFGQPSYIDVMEKKYFYFTKKNKSSNFYNKKNIYSFLFIYELDQNDNIVGSESINLLENDIAIFQKKETENNIINRGFIEKIFGGVGPNQLPNSP